MQRFIASTIQFIKHSIYEPGKIWGDKEKDNTTPTHNMITIHTVINV